MQLRIILSPTANATKNHSHLGGKASPGCHVASGLCLGGLAEGLGRFLAFCLGNVRLTFGDAAQGQGLTVSVKHRLNIRTLGKSPDDHVRLARTDVQPMAGETMLPDGCKAFPTVNASRGTEMTISRVLVMGFAPQCHRLIAADGG
jgi:hypothetical protein